MIPSPSASSEASEEEHHRRHDGQSLGRGLMVTFTGGDGRSIVFARSAEHLPTTGLNCSSGFSSFRLPNLPGDVRNRVQASLLSTPPAGNAAVALAFLFMALDRHLPPSPGNSPSPASCWPNVKGPSAVAGPLSSRPHFRSRSSSRAVPQPLQKSPKSGGGRTSRESSWEWSTLGAAFKYTSGRADHAALFVLLSSASSPSGQRASRFHLRISAWSVISIVTALYLLICSACPQ